MSGRLLRFRRSPPAGEPTTLTSGVRPPSGGQRGGAATFSRPIAASRFRELVAPHVDAAYSLARYLARDPAAAEDIAQEALLKAFRNIEALRGEPRPWLMAIVRNAYFDWRRRGDDRLVGGSAGETVLAQAPDPDQESVETTLIRRGDVEALRSAIADIPEPFREALVLRDLEELSYREVAEITGAPMGTVMSRIARARRMLGERLGVMESAS
jgi:RNA polymerase sigma-70 factor (ECF subfamily)